MRKGRQKFNEIITENIGRVKRSQLLNINKIVEESSLKNFNEVAVLPRFE